MGDPDWYSYLSPWAQECVDQMLHITLGFLIAMFVGSFFSIVVLFVREFWVQWPVERVADTRLDMAFWISGIGFAEIAGMIS